MPLTVLQIIPAMGTGGAEQAVVEIASGLLARGDRAWVVSSGGRRVADLQGMGAVHLTRDVKTKNPFKIIRNAYWLADLIRREKIDIVHARSRAPAWSAYLACRMTRTVYVTTFHAAYHFKSNLKKAYNAVMAKGLRVIAISPFIAAHVRTEYGLSAPRLVTINRGVDLADYNPEHMPAQRIEAARAALGAATDRPVIILPGRLSPIKGQAIALRALSLIEQHSAIKPQLLIIGDDQGRTAYSTYLKDLTHQLRLDELVRFTGAWGDMAAAYALATLTLVPSQVAEGFGRVPVESMAMGVPVIASALGAMQDTILDGRTGWLVAPDRAEPWAAQIEKALADKAHLAAVGQEGRAHVLSHYSREKMVAETLAVYDFLCLKHG